MYGIKLLAVRTNYSDKLTITAMLSSSFVSNNTMKFAMKIPLSRRKAWAKVHRVYCHGSGWLACDMDGGKTRGDFSVYSYI